MAILLASCAHRVENSKITLRCDFRNVLTERTSQHVPIALFTATSRLEEPKPKRSCDMLVRGCYFATRYSRLLISWMVFEEPGIHAPLPASKDYIRERSETVHA